MLPSADARSGIRFLPTLVIGGIVAALPWLIPWFGFAGLGGWPSNDDPYYAKPLANWAEDGQWQWVRQYGALTASSVAHVFAGLVTTLGDSFSYRSLYLICIFQQALGVAMLFWFSRRLELPLRFALGLAAGLAFFPLYYGHAFTFMTDGPATAFAAIGLTVGMWGIVRRDWRWLFASSLAIAWGYWIRQTDLLILLVPLATLWLTKAQAGPNQSGKAILTLSLIAPAAIAIAVFEWGGWMPGSVTRVEDVAPKFDQDYWHQAAIGAYGWLLICGWFGLPWLVAFLSEAKKASRDLTPKARWACHLGAVLVGLLALVPFLATSGRASLTSATGNFIQNAHIGPIFTSDMDEPGRWGSLNGVEWPFWIWQSLSLLSLLTIAVMAWWGMWTICRAWACCSQRREAQSVSEKTESDSDNALPMAKNSQEAMAFGALACLAAIACGVVVIVFLIEPHMDRYWLFLLPILSVWWVLLAALRRWTLSAPAMLWAGMWLIGHLTMSVVFTHDMLAWNNARWSWVNNRLDNGFEARDIDGGRDVNAWLRMDEDVNTFARPGDPSPWWSGFATWAIATGPRPGWQIAERLPWDSWATGKTHELLVLKRIAEEPPSDPKGAISKGPVP